MATDNGEFDSAASTGVARSPAFAYILPFAGYLVGTSVASSLSEFYAVAYAGVVVVVGAMTWFLLRGTKTVTPHWRVGAAVLVGLVGIGLWIGLSHLRLEEQLAAMLPAWLRPGPRAGFDPFGQLAGAWAVWGFIAVRLAGLAVLVPVAEELFWRGFLLRWLDSPDWRQVPPGRFRLVPFAIVVLLFTAAHPEWLAAAVYCALLNGLYYWKKDLWDCIVAHAVSNLILGVYVVTTGNWWLW